MVGVFAQSGGSFKPVASIPVNNGGTWQNAQELWAKDNGIWVKIFPVEVREPATGDLFQVNQFMWFRRPGNNTSQVWWGGTQVGVTSSEAVSMVIGAWTYYRGGWKEDYGNSQRYGIYRIGLL